MNPTVPMPLVGRIEFACADERGLRDGLRALLAASADDVGPNVLWAPGYHVAIIVGGPR